LLERVCPLGGLNSYLEIRQICDHILGGILSWHCSLRRISRFIPRNQNGAQKDSKSNLYAAAGDDDFASGWVNWGFVGQKRVGANDVSYFVISTMGDCGYFEIAHLYNILGKRAQLPSHALCSLQDLWMAFATT